MRKALVVGINYYEHGTPLFGCVDDAHAVVGSHGHVVGALAAIGLAERLDELLVRRRRMRS